jgi:hypothetical protein
MPGSIRASGRPDERGGRQARRFRHPRRPAAQGRRLRAFLRNPTFVAGVVILSFFI